MRLALVGLASVVAGAFAACGRGAPPSMPSAFPDPRPATVRLRVTGPDGRPVPGAVVEVVPRPDPISAVEFALGREVALDPSARASTATTDAQGVAEVGGLVRGAWIATVRADGFAPRSWLVHGGHAGRHLIDATLGRAATVRGRVIVADGPPPAGTEVLLDIPLDRAGWMIDDGPEVLRGACAADGAFRIDGAPADAAGWQVELPGCVPVELSDSADSRADGVVLRVHRPAELVIQVVNTNRQGLAGVDVAARFHRTRRAVVATTGPDGRASLPVPRVDADGGVTADLAATTPGAFVPVPQSCDLHGERAWVGLTAVSGCDLTGRVVDPDGRPVAGARLDLATDMVRVAEWSRRTRTDADGRYEFDRMLATAWEFRVSAPGFAEVVQPVVVSKTAPTTADFVLARDPGPWTVLHGTVRRADGRAVDGARVVVEFHDGGLTQQVTWTSSAPDGSFTLAAIDDAGPVEIRVTSPDGADVRTGPRPASEFRLPLELVVGVGPAR